MDLIVICGAIGVVLALIGLATAIFWPMNSRDDVMQHVHGDQPRWPQ